MNNDFAGKKLLVIGGTSGMGLETARVILEHRGQAFVTGLHKSKVAAALEQLSKHGKADGIAIDITDEKQRVVVEQRRGVAGLMPAVPRVRLGLRGRRPPRSGSGRQRTARHRRQSGPGRRYTPVRPSRSPAVPPVRPAVARPR